MIKFYKMLFVSTLMISTLISVSSHSWLGIWIGLEINLLSMIPLMNSAKNMMATEASIKYFITQALASTILLFSFLMIVNLNNVSQTPMLLALNSSLLTKMGAAPFHFWFPEVIEGLSWTTSFLLLTWQKIAPMVILMYNINTLFFSSIILMCMIISGIMGLNQISLRKILAYSSINHIGWMISTMIFMESIWMYYMLIYTIITANIILIFSKLNVSYLKQLFNSMTSNQLMKILFVMNFMSLGGLPPFLGFFPKWITINLLTQNNMLMLPIMMIVLTLITLFFYMRITFNTILLSSNEMNTLKLPMSKNYLILTFNILSVSGLIYATMILNLN
uniref:NADH-ubiquinone oxidoreductase chain 2 n=1 Tax=Amphiops globus TaxID=1205654 RepID=A0A0S2MN28_9COLE|nr:NADH deshydrogenase subunit 2 [Amphiops globus]